MYYLLQIVSTLIEIERRKEKDRNASAKKRDFYFNFIFATFWYFAQTKEI